MTRANALQYVRARVGRSVVIGLMACLGVSLIAQGAAGPPLTNTDVIKLVVARLSDAVIVTAIESAPRADFDLSTNSLVALKQNMLNVFFFKSVDGAKADTDSGRLERVIVLGLL